MERHNSDELMQCTPPYLKEVAESAQVDLLPKKSRTKYEAAYESFQKFKKDHKTSATSQNVVFAYFKELSKNHASSTLWNFFSMHKAVIKLKEKVDIGSYETLVAFLKKQLVGFEPKQSEVFTKEQIRKFLSDAPDTQYLATKVKNNLFFNVIFCNTSSRTRTHTSLSDRKTGK